MSSLAFHALLLLVMALIVVTLDRPPTLPPLELGWIVERPEPEIAESDVPEIRIPSIQLPQAGPPERPDEPEASEPAAQSGNRDEPPAVIPVPTKDLLELRRDALQEDGPAGHDADVIEAVRRSLDWFAKQQQSDGRWQLEGPYPDGVTQSRFRADAGATALALLCFVGAGQTHQDGNYVEVVRSGVDWLRSAQKPTGEIFERSEIGLEPRFYAHSQATIVLCELLTLTGDESLREPATRAVAYLLEAQNPEQGGWRYHQLTATGEGDVSVTGWALMALHSARMADIDVPPETWLLASQFLDTSQEHPGDAAFYKYRPSFPVNRGQRLSMTAEGLLCRQWLGWPRNLPALQRGVAFLTDEDNRPVWDDGKRNVYAWYYVAQTLHNLGGDDWEQWYAHTAPVLVTRQVKSGRSRGSWHPHRPPGSPHEWSQIVGRLYFTAMCTLILETPFRHGSVYE
ncbi:prenyltransferase/squalene oxidase repeat-containing protein [Maioricimonas rarisocia]|nr:prenyltransferase/squalene oxidase repeat-containing protein [Maioricimonas rarisocia]